MTDPKNKVIKDFGNEWKRFNQNKKNSLKLKSNLKESFNYYFVNFPWETLPESAIGFDLGCGSGRWAKFVAPKVGKLICIEPSKAALNVAKTNLSDHSNCEFQNISVEQLTLEDNSMDFGYSLGVLHHIQDTQTGINNCVKKLKKGAPFLIYLYYAFDNRPYYYKMLWRVTNPFRIFISKMPFPIKVIFTELIAFLIYYPLSRIAKIFEFFGFDVKNFPLSHYKDLSMYLIRTDSLDRFGTSVEKRFTKKEISNMLNNAGISRIIFNKNLPYWCAIGFKD